MQSKIENQKSKISGGFTLIELLVVIAIIGILMGLLFPALHAARHRARVTRARMEMKQIETAWTSYRSDYRQFPPPNVYGALGPQAGYMNENAVRILRGEDVQGRNPRKIAYMEFPDGVLDPLPGVPGPVGFRDPWGAVYRLRLATSGNSVTFMLPPPTTLYRPVAVFSTGYSATEPITSW